MCVSLAAASDRMRQGFFDAEHDLFRETVRAFYAEAAVPSYEEWQRMGIVDRGLFAQAGSVGLLGFDVPEEYGGGGHEDFRFNVIMSEEAQLAGVAAAGLVLSLHNDMCLPYYLKYCTPEQKARWLPGLASGELVSAIAMTEPNTGSDLSSIQTSAHKNGDQYVLNGAKTFITNGINADLVIVVARTDPDAGRDGFSLLLVERGMSGFERGRNLDKIGLHAQDTAELFFDEVHVPEENLLGAEGQGFAFLMENLAQERISIAVSSLAAAEVAVNLTLEYVEERKAFGSSIGSFQNTKFELADCYAKIVVTQAYLDRCVLALNAGALNSADAAVAKLRATEIQKKTVDRCLQLFGGYGYMSEYPIARMFVDARAATIYGGTSEIMKSIIAKDLGLSPESGAPSLHAAQRCGTERDCR